MKPVLSTVFARHNFRMLPTEELHFWARKQMMSANSLVSKQISVTKAKQRKSERSRSKKVLESSKVFFKFLTTATF